MTKHLPTILAVVAATPQRVRPYAAIEAPAARTTAPSTARPAPTSSGRLATPRSPCASSSTPSSRQWRHWRQHRLSARQRSAGRHVSRSGPPLSPPQRVYLDDPVLLRQREHRVREVSVHSGSRYSIRLQSKARMTHGNTIAIRNNDTDNSVFGFTVASRLRPRDGRTYTYSWPATSPGHTSFVSNALAAATFSHHRRHGVWDETLTLFLQQRSNCAGSCYSTADEGVSRPRRAPAEVLHLPRARSHDRALSR